MYLKQTTSKFICICCQEPAEFNLFLQTHLKWNQRKSFKTNGLFPSIVERVDVFLEGTESKTLDYKISLNSNQKNSNTIWYKALQRVIDREFRILNRREKTSKLVESTKTIYRLF